MKGTTRKFTQAQRVALLKGFAISGLTIRKYAALNNVGLSTLSRWSTRTGISLREQGTQVDNRAKALKTITEAESANSSHNSKCFSFIDITDHSSFIPIQASGKVLLSRLEIHMPNGITLKIEQIPFDKLLPQLVELTKSFFNVT